MTDPDLEPIYEILRNGGGFDHESLDQIEAHLARLPALFTVDASFTTQRPVIPDERTHRLTFWAESDTDAHLTAAQWVANRPGVVMPTRTVIVAVEL